MSKFTDQLWSDLVEEHGATLALADRPGRGRSRRTGVLRRPRVLAAGSTLGLAGIGAALLLILGGSSAPPAFAITRDSDGSVLVQLSYAQDQNLPQVESEARRNGAPRADRDQDGDRSRRPWRGR